MTDHMSLVSYQQILKCGYGGRDFDELSLQIGIQRF